MSVSVCLFVRFCLFVFVFVCFCLCLFVSSLTRDAVRARGVDTDTTRSLKLALAEKRVERLSSHGCPFEGLLIHLHHRRASAIRVLRRRGLRRRVPACSRLGLLLT